jgi:hypothetical protein
MPMCLVLVWNARFEAKYVAPTLSQNKIGAIGSKTPSSPSRDCILYKFAAVLAKALYSN